MHQPDYRGPDDGDYQLPWVYLHGIKDYVDMVSYLEANHDARAVVNFVPTLLEQIVDYAAQIRAWLDEGTRIGDPLLDALASPQIPADRKARANLLRACKRVNKTRLVDRFQHFRDLFELARLTEKHPGCVAYFSDQYFADLLMWYHIAWMGESGRANDVRLQALAPKARDFTAEDRHQLLTIIAELLDAIIPRYRRLAQQGRVELSVTPYAHPIMPLLIDMQSAREATADIKMPEVDAYPEGEDRAIWHTERGLEVFEKFFGFRPIGCWPAEGAISTPTLELLQGSGFRWVASGQEVLHNSLVRERGGALPANWIHRPYKVDDTDFFVFFRDDGLSDLIGFTYSDWHADDAVDNFVRHLETIAENTAGQDDALVSIIMDGENAWEYYPNNGAYFLSALYERLSSHPKLELTTFSSYIESRPLPSEKIKSVVTGSWVFGSLTTWIGDRDKNRAWEMLVDAKRVFDRVLASGRLSDSERDAAEQQLAICEGSDWFWWFGDYNPSSTVADFESLFRRQLEVLYTLLGEKSPSYLSEVFARGSGNPDKGGVMRQAN